MLPRLTAVSAMTIAILGFTSAAHTASYTYELSDQQTWSDGGEVAGNTQYVSVRAYVPGSKSISYRTVPIYTPVYSSEANTLGDIVGSVFNIYGSGTTAFADPYDGAKKTVIYPAPQILHTRLLAVNDDRLAIGGANVLLASGKTLWFDATTIIKYNDASGFEPGQRLEFKAWLNPDGSLVGIKVEVP